ncbi:MAG: M23 family metallopeptidase [Flavobacteriaceae bacterium]
MKYLTLCIALSASWLGLAQYYQAPVDIPIQLSGTFAELRGTHFHAGLDIRTQGKEGLPLRAVADGYVSRIKIQQGGYGKALYINHPNGTTSVYAHLQRYGDIIVPHVRKKQYAKKSYTIHFYPEPEDIPIKKGEIIGYSGNTGSSFGPHLHFELRNSANQIPFNPLLDGILIPDTQRPEIKEVFAYPLLGAVNQSEEKIQLSIAQKNDSTFVADTVYALGEIGFGVSHYDRQDGSYNKNGTFEIATQLNGKKKFYARFDTLTFDDTSQMHKLIDYAHYVDTKKKVMRLFNPFQDAVPFVDFFENGTITCEVGKSYTYQVKLSDVAGNNTYLIIPIVGKKEEVWIHKNPPHPGKVIYPQRDYLFELNNSEIYVGAKTFSAPTPLDIYTKKDTLYIENPHAYFSKPYKLTFKKNDTLLGEYLALRRNKNWGYVTTRNKKGVFSTKLKNTGAITVLQDTIPPTITDQKNIANRWISLEKDLRFTIDDKETGIDRFKGYLNGNWILFEYEQKKKLLTFTFKDPIKLSKVKHNLKLIVWDKVGNNTTFEATFYRKE